MKPKVYIETSIPSYLTAWPSRDLVKAARQQIIQEWWQTRRGDFDLLTSQVVLDEASTGNPEFVKRRLESLEGIPLLDVNQDAIALAEELVHHGPLPEKATVDALHIGIAVVNGMDYLLTWNLTHIANAAMRNKIEQVCRSKGYEPPIICTPDELMEEGGQ